MVGLARLVLKREQLSGGLNTIDKLVIAWGTWYFFASFFHKWEAGSGPVYTGGVLLNTIGFYFMMRSFSRTSDDLSNIFVALCIALAPVAILMAIESFSKFNIFSFFGGVPERPELRNGRYRAQGPFNHAILAGTVGALCFPLAIAIWKQFRLASIIGIASTSAMVVFSASSGPIMSFTFALFALVLWKSRGLVRLLQIAFIPAYILLDLMMERPAYFIISKINLTGASTGYHRALLIQQTFKHLDEWWLFGTDRTVHWMRNQGRISEFHTDITNQYIAYGVAAGLPCLVLFLIVIFLTFRTIGRMVSLLDGDSQTAFVFWAVGASLFSICTSAISVGFFGQALFFLWLPVAIVASFYNLAQTEKEASYASDGLNYSY